MIASTSESPGATVTPLPANEKSGVSTHSSGVIRGVERSERNIVSGSVGCFMNGRENLLMRKNQLGWPAHSTSMSSFSPNTSRAPDFSRSSGITLL